MPSHPRCAATTIRSSTGFAPTIPPTASCSRATSQRRALAEGEAIETFMVQAAQSALADAHLLPADIDIVLGFTSVSDYTNPNGLAQVHAALGLCRQLLGDAGQRRLQQLPRRVDDRRRPGGRRPGAQRPGGLRQQLDAPRQLPHAAMRERGRWRGRGRGGAHAAGFALARGGSRGELPERGLRQHVHAGRPAGRRRAHAGGSTVCRELFASLLPHHRAGLERVQGLRCRGAAQGRGAAARTQCHLRRRHCADLPTRPAPTCSMPGSRPSGRHSCPTP